jgi:hypothetical protein
MSKPIKPKFDAPPILLFVGLTIVAIVVTIGLATLMAMIAR